MALTPNNENLFVAVMRYVTDINIQNSYINYQYRQLFQKSVYSMITTNDSKYIFDFKSHMIKIEIGKKHITKDYGIIYDKAKKISSTVFSKDERTLFISTVDKILLFSMVTEKLTKIVETKVSEVDYGIRNMVLGCTGKILYVIFERGCIVEYDIENMTVLLEKSLKYKVFCLVS